MIGLSRGLARGSATLRSVIKSGLQAWYKADRTQAPLGEEEIANGDFSLGPELVVDGNFDSGEYTPSPDGTNGWIGDGTLSHVTEGGDSFLRAVVASTTVNVLFYGNALTNTKNYIIKFRAKSTKATTFGKVGPNNTSYISSTNPTLSTDWKDYEFHVTASDTACRFYTTDSLTTSDTLDIDNVTIKQSNPNDSWIVGAGWALEDGEATCSSGNETLGQEVSPIAGRKYKIAYTISAITSGQLFIKIGNCTAYTDLSPEVGTKEIYLTADNTDKLKIYGGTFRGTISGISVKEITNSVKDFSPNTNNGVLYSGKCLDFDGSGDYVAIADDDSLDVGAGDFTLAAWVYCDALTTGQVILSKLNTTTGYQLKKGTNDASNHLYLEVDDGSEEGVESYNFGAASALVQDTWYRIVVVADRDVAPHLYINGELISSPTTSSDGNTWSSISSGSLDSTAGLHIGAYAHDQSLPWYGMIADVQVYKKAWTVSDVAYDWENPDKDVFDDEGRAKALGPELITNGDFSDGSTGYYSADKGWSISNNQLVHDGTDNAGWAMQVIPRFRDSAAGTTYEVTFDVVSATSADVRVYDPKSSVYLSQTLNTGDRPTYQIEQGFSRHGSIAIRSYDSSEVVLDNISVKEILYHKAEISPTDCTALYRLNEGAGDRVYNAAPVLREDINKDYDFTSGWSGINATGDSANTFTSSGAGGLYKGQVTVGSIYKATVTGTTTASSGFRFKNAGNSDIYFEHSSSGEFSSTFVFTATHSETYLFNNSTGTTTITTLETQEISLPNSYAITGAGWETAQPYIPQYAMSSYSKKMVFDGSNDYVALGSKKTIAADEAFSLSFWFLANQTSNPEFPLGTNDSTSYIRINPSTPDVINFKMGGGDQIPIEFDADNAYDAGGVNHVVITGAASGTGTLKLYLNGILQADTGTRASNDFDYYYIGSYNEDGEPDRYEGFLDEFAHFSTELSATEVQELFNGGMALDCRDHSAYTSSEWLNLTNQEGGLNKGAQSSLLQPISIVSSNSISFDDTYMENFEFEDESSDKHLWSAFNEDGISEGVDYSYSFPFTPPAGSVLKISGRITKNDGSGDLFDDTNNNGYIAFRFNTDSVEVGVFTSGSSDYHVDSNGRFSFEYTLDSNLALFKIMANAIKSITGDPGVLISELSVKEVDLKGYWRNNGVESWTDLSPYGNNGTVNGSPTTIQLQEVPYFKKDTFGLPMNRVRQRGLNFDGDSYVEVEDDTSLGAMNDGFTCSFWYRHAENTASPDYFYLVTRGRGLGDGVDYGFAVAIFNNVIYFDINTDHNTNTRYNSTYNLGEHSAIDKWHYITATYDGTDMILYVDAENRDSNTVSGDISNTAEAYPLTIGRSNLIATQRARTVIDEVKWYDRDLSQAEITKNFKATKSKHLSTSSWSDDFSNDFI
jgi:hypothetical protein